MIIENLHPITVGLTMRGCPRCRDMHEHIEAKPLKFPTVFTHFSQCPVTGEPIMFDDDFGLNQLEIKDGIEPRRRKEPT